MAPPEAGREHVLGFQANTWENEQNLIVVAHRAVHMARFGTRRTGCRSVGLAWSRGASSRRCCGSSHEHGDGCSGWAGRGTFGCGIPRSGPGGTDVAARTAQAGRQPRDAACPSVHGRWVLWPRFGGCPESAGRPRIVQESIDFKTELSVTRKTLVPTLPRGNGPFAAPRRAQRQSGRWPFCPLRRTNRQPYSNDALSVLNGLLRFPDPRGSRTPRNRAHDRSSICKGPTWDRTRPVATGLVSPLKQAAVRRRSMTNTPARSGLDSHVAGKQTPAGRRTFQRSAAARRRRGRASGRVHFPGCPKPGHQSRPVSAASGRPGCAG